MLQAERTRIRTRTRSTSYCTVRGRLWDPRSFAPDSPPGLFVAGPGRFHLYADRGAAAHRSALVIALAGLGEAISVSYQDDPGRPARIPALRDAYRASGVDIDSATPVPALWDRRTGRIVTNDYATLEKDLATEFADWSGTGLELYPADLRDGIDELDRWLGPVIGPGPRRRGADGLLDEAFARLDRTLAHSRHLLGDRLTLADVRLWVMLVRFGPEAGRPARISSALAPFTSLWAYAQDLSERPGFRTATGPRGLRRPQF
ncbi:glutathione S-transferase C-terminal domain-containing protein [Kineosporia sp. J2-2]|uniref:Glutathione S-transferase C-terminal domain-containing protein n=1 Tax=Kineosporia corallincola TaxID=2835133 RepID=A0ABS5TED2_9ACTN|nr:glutathione S-transferase C-terminal domain-containing protein [Kineosporia corallincola]MBT0768794.1 glutathione S-transferase C-terminal domain-containing protein [Kineosporia corallincola]